METEKRKEKLEEELKYSKLAEATRDISYLLKDITFDLYSAKRQEFAALIGQKLAQSRLLWISLLVCVAVLLLSLFQVLLITSWFTASGMQSKV